MVRKSKQLGRRAVPPISPPPPIAPTLIPSSNYSPSSRRFSAKSPHILSRTAHSPSQASAKLSSGVSTKSPEPNAPHTLQIQDTVNLNGKRLSAQLVSL